MERVLSTHLFLSHRLTSVWLERIANAGFQGVEIFCAKPHLNYSGHSQINELAHWFRDSELKLWSVHSPMYSDDVRGVSGPGAVMNIADLSKARRASVVEEVKRAIDIADQIPFRYLIQHLGVEGEEFDEAKLDAALSSIEQLKVYAGQRGVEILLENTPNDLASAERLKYFLGATHLNLGYCFDIGHAHLLGSVAGQFSAMKERIRSTHIHDNDGTDDTHGFPLRGAGTIDWQGAMTMLGSRPAQFPLVLELREQAGLEHPIEEARRTLDELMKLQ